MKYLNIGCGTVFDPSWVNIDIVSTSPMVISHNILKGLPFAECHFNACYSSHLIEHLTQNEAQKLLRECLRVLSSGGIIRLAVPDLEAIAKNYLTSLEQAINGDSKAEANYSWMMLELYDQTVRNYSGGEMGKYLSNPAIENKEFVLSRIGNEAESYWQKDNISTLNKENLLTKLKNKNLLLLIKKSRIAMAKLLVFLIGGREYTKAFEEGIFRVSGEVHQWMYDRFSLKRMLEQCGFVNIKICKADESSIPNFNSYSLDILKGKVRKPDSLFMEGSKP